MCCVRPLRRICGSWHRAIWLSMFRSHGGSKGPPGPHATSLRSSSSGTAYLESTLGSKLKACAELLLTRFVKRSASTRSPGGHDKRHFNHLDVIFIEVIKMRTRQVIIFAYGNEMFALEYLLFVELRWQVGSAYISRWWTAVPPVAPKCRRLRSPDSILIIPVMANCKMRNILAIWVVPRRRRPNLMRSNPSRRGGQGSRVRHNNDASTGSHSLWWGSSFCGQAPEG